MAASMINAWIPGYDPNKDTSPIYGPATPGTEQPKSDAPIMNTAPTAAPPQSAPVSTNPMIDNLYADYMKSQPKAAGYTATQATNPTWTVDPNQTVQGQIQGMLAKGSPLWTQVTTRANQQMARRGVMDSSMAMQAGQAALYDAAVPIATSDASMFGAAARSNAEQGAETARFNTGETNTAGRFGADAENQMTRDTRQVGGNVILQKGQQAFQSGENAADRAYGTSERLGRQGFESGESALNRALTASENQLGRKFTAEERIAGQQFAAGENKLGRDFTAAERLAGQAFVAQRDADAREHDFKITAQNHANRLEELGFQNNFATAQVPQEYAAKIATGVMNQVNAILADGNLTPDAKRNAISNVVAFGNNTMSLAEKLWKTDLPDLTDPSDETP